MKKKLTSLIATLVVMTSCAAEPVYATERKPSVVREFRKLHACPSTGSFKGACTTHVVDHVIALCMGGADSVDNMMWQEKAASYKKDVTERKICRQLKACLKEGK